MDRLRLAQGRGRYLAEPDRPDLAGGDHFAERADRFLDRHLPVPAMEIIEVDPVGAEPLQAFLERASQRLRASVDDPLAVDAGHSAFRSQHIFGSAVPDRLADQPLVGAEAVKRRSIDQVVAQIERAIEQPRRIVGGGRRAIGMAEGHAAEADRMDRERTEPALRDHGRFPAGRWPAWE